MAGFCEHAIEPLGLLTRFIVSMNNCARWLFFILAFVTYETWWYVFMDHLWCISYFVTKWNPILCCYCMLLEKTQSIILVFPKLHSFLCLLSIVFYFSLIFNAFLRSSSLPLNHQSVSLLMPHHSSGFSLFAQEKKVIVSPMISKIVKTCFLFCILFCSCYKNQYQW